MKEGTVVHVDTHQSMTLIDAEFEGVALRTSTVQTHIQENLLGKTILGYIATETSFLVFAKTKNQETSQDIENFIIPTLA